MDISFAGYRTSLEENPRLFRVLQAAEERLGTSKNHFWNERGWEGYETPQDAVDDHRQRVEEAAETEARDGLVSDLGVDLDALLRDIAAYAAGELWESIPEGADDRLFETLSTGQKTIKITVAELENRWGSSRGEWGFGTDEADDDEVIRFAERDTDEGIYVPQRVDNFGDWQTVDSQTFTADLEPAD